MGLTMHAHASVSCRVQYIELPKCAATSIKTALLASDGVEVGPPYWSHSHRRWDEIPDDFRPLLTFTFVRHPLDRLVSSWHEKLKRGLAKQLVRDCPLAPDASFAAWVEWVTSIEPQKSERHWKPQAFILDNRGWPDFIGQFEMLAWQWNTLSQVYGLPTLERVNASRRGPGWRHYYTPHLLALAVQFYAADFARLGYDPEFPFARRPAQR